MLDASIRFLLIFFELSKGIALPMILAIISLILFIKVHYFLDFSNTYDIIENATNYKEFLWKLAENISWLLTVLSSVFFTLNKIL